MSKVAGERYVYKFIDTEAICQFNPELISISGVETSAVTTTTTMVTSSSAAAAVAARATNPTVLSTLSVTPSLKISRKQQSSKHRYQPYVHKYSSQSASPPLVVATPCTATTTTTTMTTVVHHPISIGSRQNQLNNSNNYDLVNATNSSSTNNNNYLLSEPNGLSISTNYAVSSTLPVVVNAKSCQSVNKSIDMSSSASSSSTASSSSYYSSASDSPRLNTSNVASTTGNANLVHTTSTPNCLNSYYKYQTPVNFVNNKFISGI